MTMRYFLSHFLIILLFPLLVSANASPWQHALTLFGTPKYKASFRHFDYVNPKAPKGGQFKFAHPATFDSLNPYILKGVKAPGMNMLFETLMTASLDEPQTFYPLITERFRMDTDETWIEFRLNPSAKWHDGKPITPEDVIFSLKMMKEEADPVYRLSFTPLEKAEITGKHTVKFTFAEPKNREAPILAASMPVLPKHYYQTHDFTKTTLTPPLGSGPYKIGTFEPGRFITLERVESYWGRNLPANIGRHNFQTIRYDVYRDATVALEALKAGEVDLRQENISRNWATAYDIPALKEGRLKKEEIPNKLPQGMQAFFYNVRQPELADRAVREAIALTMDYEWINKALFYGAYKRNSSFFQYTPFAAEGLPEREELALLEPFRDQLPPQLFTKEFQLPKTDGSGQNRKNLLKAQTLLEKAGYKLIDGKHRIHPETGKPLKIEFMLNQPTMQRVILPMLKGLKQIGIDGRIRLVDDAQYQRRIETRDFDIISGWINLGVFFPGVEQQNYWHSSQADINGSNNTTGLKHPAVDAMIERIMNATTLEELTPPARALDRILLREHLVIPHWHNNTFRTAWWDKFGRPDENPPYGLAIDCWWIKKDRQ